MDQPGGEPISNLITRGLGGKKKASKVKKLRRSVGQKSTQGDLDVPPPMVSPIPQSNIQEVSPVASASRDQVQRAALLASLSGRSFEDVKFFAFSCCTRDGNANKPLPLLANSALLRKASSHFDFGLYASDLVFPYFSTDGELIRLYLVFGEIGRAHV